MKTEARITKLLELSRTALVAHAMRNGIPHLGIENKKLAEDIAEIEAAILFNRIDDFETHGFFSY